MKIREETSHWHGVFTQIVNLILQGRLSLAMKSQEIHQVRKKQGSEQTCCSNEVSQFSGLLDTCEARWASKANGTYTTVTVTEAVRMMQSRMWNFKTRGTKSRITPTHCSFINRCSSQPHRWQNSQPPPHNQLSMHTGPGLFRDTLASVMASQHKETFVPRRMTGTQMFL